MGRSVDLQRFGLDGKKAPDYDSVDKFIRSQAMSLYTDYWFHGKNMPEIHDRHQAELIDQGYDPCSLGDTRELIRWASVWVRSELGRSEHMEIIRSRVGHVRSIAFQELERLSSLIQESGGKGIRREVIRHFRHADGTKSDKSPVQVTVGYYQPTKDIASILGVLTRLLTVEAQIEGVVEASSNDTNFTVNFGGTLITERKQIPEELFHSSGENGRSNGNGRGI